MPIRPLLLACCASLVVAAPANATPSGRPADPVRATTTVVGGEPIAFSDAPWFAMVASCGGTLVAPDRVLTAAHCFNGQSAADVEALSVAGRTVGVANIALAPGFEHRNGSGNYLNDAAIVQLAQPVTDVAPVALGGTDAAEARIIGTGRQYAPGTGHSEAEMLAP